MKLEVFSHRWGRIDTYTIERTATGWKVFGLIRMTEGDCDKTGAPSLFENLDHDSINYPKDLGGYMEWLWQQAEDRKMSEAEIQENLDMLGKWIQTVEKSSPRGGIWESY
jgi:hypothetical protein